MAKLTVAQNRILKDLADSDTAWRTAKATAAAEAQRMVERQIDALAAERARLTYVARNAEIPKARIGRMGLHSTHPRIVEEVLERFAAIEDLPTANPDARFSWEKRADQTIRVHYPEFPTRATHADDYPAVLSGVVQFDPKARAGWVVIHDDSDKVTEFGTLPGWLRWEIEEAPQRSDGATLRDMLHEWKSVN